MSEVKKANNKFKVLIGALVFILLVVVIVIIVSLTGKDTRNENPYDIYGKYVNYKSDGIDGNLKWRIYYTDNSNIYLISDKNAEDVTLSKNIDEYKGSEDVNKSKYSKYLLWSQKNIESTNNNVKSVAYLVDTEKWEKYAKNVAADYAVASPSIDMLVCSYNKLYDNKLTCELGTNGYKVKFEKDETISSSLKLSDIQYDVSKKTSYEDLYNLESEGTETLVKAWISSNSDYNGDSVFELQKTLNNNINHTETSGIRPVICLKSAARLKLRDDGTYDIVYNVWTQIQEKIREVFRVSSNKETEFNKYVKTTNTEVNRIDTSMNKYELDNLIYGLPKNYKEDYDLPYDIQAGVSSGYVYYCYEAPEGVEYYCVYITSFDAADVSDASYSEVCVNEMCNAIAYYSDYYDINIGSVTDKNVNGQKWLMREVDVSPNSKGKQWGNKNDTEFNFVTKNNDKVYFAQFWVYGQSRAKWTEDFEKILNTFSFK